MPISQQYPASRLAIDGVIVRPIAYADIPAVLRALEESLAELRRFLPWAHEPATVESQVDRIRFRPFTLGLFEDDRFLASCGMSGRVPLNPDGLEIGWWVRTRETGQGLATLACRALTIYCVQGLGVDRVQIAHNPDNHASARVIQKCGFVFEGRVRNSLSAPPAAFVAKGLSPGRDVLTYSLLPDEARAQPWFAELAPRIQVFDLLGNDLGKPW